MAEVLKIEDLIVQFNSGATGEILKTQTTYLEVICSFQSVPLQDKFRIQYRGKREFSLGKGKFTSLQLFNSHLLLLKYKEPIVSVHLASLVTDRQKFREEFDVVTCARKITPSEWRESTKMKIGDSSNEKDIYRRANRRYLARL